MTKTLTQSIRVPWTPILVDTMQNRDPLCIENGSEVLSTAILWAAPKKKTSYSKKRMRQATKGLKDLYNLNECPACGRKKLAHTLCLFCFREIKEFIKSRQE